MTYGKWLENTHKRPENKDRSRKLKKKDPYNPFRILGRKSVPIFVQHLKVHIYKHNMRPNFTEKNNIRTKYLQIPCQTLSVICMEIGGRVKLSENVHNIWISARKPVVCPQTRYRTRRNIVPKFLKNATKTLFAFCVFNDGRIYLSIPRKTKKCMLFRSNAHKNSRNFSCVHHYFFCSHQG